MLHVRNTFRTILAIIFLAFGSIFQPAFADSPKGVSNMLAKAAEINNRISFDAVLFMAIETWPEKRVDILRTAQKIKPYWLNDDFLDEIEEERVAFEEAEAASRARGFVYYVDPELWNAQFEFGAGASTGDTDEKALSAGMNFKREFGNNWEHELDVDFNFARSGSKTTREKLVIKYETLWRPWENAFLLNYTELELDRFSGFKYRLVENIGAGLDLLDDGTHKLRLEGGPGLRFSELSETGEKETEYLGRVSTTYDVKLSRNLGLKDRSAIIFAAESTTFENLAQLSAKLTKSLAARLSLQVKYDSNAPVDTSQWDTSTRASLIFGF